MSSSSLVVKIAADINDFSRKMDSMTRGVDQAAKRLASVGTSLTIGVTAPLLATAAAFAKMGAEQQAVAAKFDRSMGSAAAGVAQTLERIHGVVPETTASLQAMANQMDQFGRGAGMSSAMAAQFSGETLKMAAVLKSATPGSTMTETTDALMRGLEGSTKGLKQFGIDINATQVKQEAYRLGLLRVGEELTPLKTSMATYALLTQRMNTLQGEASAVTRDVATQWAFLKRDATELGQSMGRELLPSFLPLIEVARGAVLWFKELSSGTKEAIIVVGALAASIGPLILALVGAASAIVKIKAALDILKDAEILTKIGDMVTGWKAAAIALAVVAVAVIGIALAWNYFKKKAEEAKASADDFFKKFKGAGDLLKLGFHDDSLTSKDPLAALRESVDLLTKSYELAIASGQDLASVVDAIRQKKASIGGDILKSDDPKFQVGASDMFLGLGRLLAAADVASILGSAGPQGGRAIGDAVSLASNQGLTQQAIDLQNSKKLIGDTDAIRVRESLIRLADSFDAPRVAALELAEKFRQTAHDFGVAASKLKSSWTSDIGASALGGLQAGLAGIMESLTPFALICEAVGKVMQGLQPVIDNLMGPLVALGQILGEMIKPLLMPLFQSLKVFGIAVALVGEVVYTVAAGIAHVVGAVIVAIGKIISKIPFLGGVGHGVESFGNQILDLSKSFGNTARELDRSRIQLQNMDFDNAASGLQNLTNSAQLASEALTNLPQTFRYTLDKFYATLPISGPVVNGPSSGAGAYPGSGGAGGGSGSGSNGGGDGTEISGNMVVAAVHLDGQKVGQVVFNRITSSTKKQFGAMTAENLAKLVVVN